MMQDLPTSRRKKPLRRIFVALVACVLGSVFIPACGVGYVVKSGWYQMEMLAKREPIQEVLLSDRIGADAAAQLSLVPGIKAFGERVGLAQTDSYESISLDWKRTIYNVSACSPVAFEPETWWFPIVGQVPYLGYFRQQDADRRAQKLSRKGLDVWVRTAGAYSTLGWFKDPVLPGMLEWSEADLAETLLHEIAHATLWVKGSVRFNESYANVIGKLAGDAYMNEKYGVDSPQVQDMLAEREDLYLWRALLHDLYKKLDAVYQDPDLEESAKAVQKAKLLASLPAEATATPFANPERFVRAASNGTWNNARLLQFKTYNAHQEAFDALLAKCSQQLGGPAATADSKISCFIEEIRGLTDGRRDPYVALYEHLNWPVPKDVKEF